MIIILLLLRHFLLPQLSSSQALQAFNPALDDTVLAFHQFDHCSPTLKVGRIIAGTILDFEVYKGYGTSPGSGSANQGISAYLRDRTRLPCALENGCFKQSVLPSCSTSSHSGGVFDAFTYIGTNKLRLWSDQVPVAVPSAGKSIAMALGGTRTLEVAWTAMQLERLLPPSATNEATLVPIKTIIGSSYSGWNAGILRSNSDSANGGTNDQRDMYLLTSAETNDNSKRAVVVVATSTDFITQVVLCDFGIDDPSRDSSFPRSMPCGTNVDLRPGQYHNMWGPRLAVISPTLFFVVSIGCTVTNCIDINDGDSDLSTRQIVIAACTTDLLPLDAPDMTCTKDAWVGTRPTYELYRKRAAYNVDQSTDPDELYRKSGTEIPGSTSQGTMFPGENPRLVGAGGGISHGRIVVAFVKHTDVTSLSGLLGIFLCKTTVTNNIPSVESCGPVFFPSQTNLPIIEILGVNVIPNEDRFAVTVAVDSGPCAGGAQVDGEMCPTTRKQELRITLCSASPNPTRLTMACTPLEDKLAIQTSVSKCQGSPPGNTFDYTLLDTLACTYALTAGKPVLRGPDAPVVDVTLGPTWRLQLMVKDTLYQWGIAEKTASGDDYQFLEDGKTVLLGFGGMSSLDEFIKTGRPNNDATFILNIQNSTGKSGQIGFPIASSIRSFVNGRKIHIQGIGNPLLNASKMTIPGSVFILSDVSNVELKLSDFTIQGKGGDTSGSAISEGSVVFVEGSGIEVKMNNMIFNKHSVKKSGGAIYLAAKRLVDSVQSTLLLGTVTFINNQAGLIGGGVAAFQPWTCLNCSFYQNKASLGASVAVGLIFSCYI